MPRRPPMRRGGAYIAVLGAAMLITVISLASIAAIRVQFRASGLADDVIAADALAQSAVQIIVDRIARDPDWRTTYTHNVWTPAENLADGTITFMLADEIDADLADDDADDVRLYARADVGAAVRIYSVLLRPPPLPNLLTNAGFESGTSPWTSPGCTISTSGTSPASGSFCLFVEDRSGTWAGPEQAVAKAGIVKNATYRFRAWVRPEDGDTSVYARLSWTANGSGSGSASTAAVVAPLGTWSLVSGDITPTWSGTLTADPTLRLRTSDSDTDLSVDDVSLVRVDGQVLEMVPGTWRREVLP